jgi:hypothetical protein
MARRGMEHRKPKAVSSKLDPDKLAAFIKKYENLQNTTGDDEGRAVRRRGASDASDACGAPCGRSSQRFHVQQHVEWLRRVLGA